jgi:hypothetical protein
MISNLAIAEDSNQALHKLVKDFETSIINKDIKKLLTLFVNNNVPMVGVHSQGDYNKALAWAKSAQGLALKKKLGNKFREPAKYQIRTPLNFVNLIQTEKLFSEKMTDIKINSNNEVATISFNYQFFEGEKLINYGVENWQVINDGENWKISAVNFSITRK